MVLDSFKIKRNWPWNEELKSHMARKSKFNTPMIRSVYMKEKNSWYAQNAMEQTDVMAAKIWNSMALSQSILSTDENSSLSSQRLHLMQEELPVLLLNISIKHHNLSYFYFRRRLTRMKITLPIILSSSSPSAWWTSLEPVFWRLFKHCSRCWRLITAIFLS